MRQSAPDFLTQVSVRHMGTGQLRAPALVHASGQQHRQHRCHGRGDILECRNDSLTSARPGTHSLHFGNYCSALTWQYLAQLLFVNEYLHHSRRWQEQVSIFIQLPGRRFHTKKKNKTKQMWRTEMKNTEPKRKNLRLKYLD